MAAPGQQLGSTRMLASRVAGGGAALRGTRVWLEGVVVARGSSRQATLDDGTGLVQLEPADKSTGFEKATPGAYVAVVGGVKRTTPFACVAQKVFTPDTSAPNREALFTLQALAAQRRQQGRQQQQQQEQQGGRG